MHDLKHRLLHMPDEDAFDAVSMKALDGLRAGDVAVVGGTVHSRGELEYQDMDEVLHPLVSESIKTLAPQIQRGVRVVCTLVNLTNLLSMPDSESVPV